MEKRKNVENWGSTLLRTKVSKQAYLLEKKTWKDVLFWEWVFMGFSVITVLTNVGFCIFEIVQGKYIFPILLILNNVFGIFFMINGVLQELPFQILIQLATKVLMWVMDLVYFATLPENPDSSLAPVDVTDESSIEDDVKKIRFYVSSALTCLNLPLGGYVVYKYWMSNVALFRTVGTEPKFVHMCRTLFLAHSLMGFDVELSVLGLILIASKVISRNQSGLPLDAIIILPVGLIFVGLWAFWGYQAMKKESRLLTFGFYVASHLQPFYMIYLCIAIADSDTVRRGSILFITTFIIVCLYFLVHSAVLVTVVRIHLNYGYGLKQAAANEVAKAKSMLNIESQPLQEPERPPPIETEI